MDFQVMSLDNASKNKAIKLLMIDEKRVQNILKGNLLLSLKLSDLERES